MIRQSIQTSSEDLEFREAYKLIKSDVKKVIAINVLIVILLLAIFFINRQTGFISKLMNFF